MAEERQAKPSTAPTVDELQRMIADEDARRDTYQVVGDAEGSVHTGGNQIDPSQGGSLPPAAPARPAREDDEPAKPGQQPQQQQAPPATLGQPPTSPEPGAQQIDVQAELNEARDRIRRLEEENARRAAEAQDREFEARLAAMETEEERSQARAEHERMLRLQSDLRLASYELRQNHPIFTQFMDAVANRIDVEIDPQEYRSLAADLEPIFRSIISEASAQDRVALQQQVQQQWGVRPTPEQAAPPPPDHPAIQRYQSIRQQVLKRPQDADLLRQLVAANNELQRLGIDSVTVT